MKIKNIILKTSILSTTFIPVVVVVSCSDDKEASKNILTDTNLSGIKKSNGTILESEKNSKVVLITDAGRVDDKSFNQSSWESISIISKQLNLENSKYLQPSAKEKFEESYKTALNSGYKYWVLSGFLHKDKILKFYYENKIEIEKKKIVIICVDFDIKGDITISNEKKQVTMKNAIGLLYKTEEAGYLAGYAASKYLHLTNDSDPKLGAFGGGDFAAVTSFIHGFLEGAIEYDRTNLNINIQYATEDITLNTGFSNFDKFKAATNALKIAEADIILPVAGPATGSVIAETDKKIIGVDVDQRISFPDNKERFLTSIKKEIGQSVYDVLLKHLTKEEQGDYAIEKTIEKGLVEQWVSIETETLKNKDNEEVDSHAKSAIDSAIDNSIQTKAKDITKWQHKDRMTYNNKKDLVNLIKELNKDPKST